KSQPAAPMPPLRQPVTSSPCGSMTSTALTISCDAAFAPLVEKRYLSRGSAVEQRRSSGGGVHPIDSWQRHEKHAAKRPRSASLAAVSSTESPTPRHRSSQMADATAPSRVPLPSTTAPSPSPSPSPTAAPSPSLPSPSPSPSPLLLSPPSLLLRSASPRCG